MKHDHSKEKTERYKEIEEYDHACVSVEFIENVLNVHEIPFLKDYFYHLLY
mgnify:CR=1 FL=1